MYTTDLSYHLYQQSNAYLPIFREEKNYRFFLKKVETHLAPFAHIFGYALMPDHFHLLIRPKPEGVADSISIKPQQNPEQGKQFQQRISHELRIMLSSYTRAFNRHYKMRGTLFRTRINAKEVDNSSYFWTCLRYIHLNPVKDGLVDVATDYPHSSARMWAGMEELYLCEPDLAVELYGEVPKEGVW
ncbi:MAG: hypothetical protein AAF741_04245 [Bacteroidota bacterium]